MIIEESTMREFGAGLDASRTVIVPFGALEEHGPHLPLGTDTLQVAAVARLAAEATGAHLAPAVPYGVCRSTRRHPGTVGVTTPTLRALVLDLVRDLHRQGMRAFCLVSGHAGKTHLLTMVDAGEQLLEELPDCRIAVVSEYEETRRAAAALVETADDSHAGEIETSRVMHLRPDLVRGSAPAEWPSFPDPLLVRDKMRFWPGGVWGDPGRASPEKGRRLVEAAAGRLAEIVRRLEQPEVPA